MTEPDYPKDLRGAEVALFLLKQEEAPTPDEIRDHFDGNLDQIEAVLAKSPNFEEVPDQPGRWRVTQAVRQSYARDPEHFTEQVQKSADPVDWTPDEQ